MTKPESQIKYIRELMELAHEYRMLPGWSAIIGGTLCLVMCVFTYFHIWFLDLAYFKVLAPHSQIILASAWIFALVIAVIIQVISTIRTSKRLGIHPMPRPARMALLALSPAFLVGAVISVKMMIDEHLRYLPSLWIMIYGIGVYTAGLFSVRAPRVLGMCFIITGAIHMMFFPLYGLVFVALSFGLYHIIFGVYVLYAYKSN